MIALAKITSRIKLGELCHVVTKGTTPTSVGLEFTDSGVPFLRIQNLCNRSVKLENVLFISEQTHQALKRSIIKPKDFLITIAGTIGKVAIVPDNFPDCNCNQAVAILRFDYEKLNPQYLLHWLNTSDAFGQISGRKVTATISNLSLGQIKELEIPLPPLPEQQKIASILDAADSLRQKDQQLIKKYTALSQSLFLEMFGDPKINPNNWPLTSLGKIIEEGPQNGLYKPSSDYGTGTPIIRIDSFHNSVVELSKLKRVRVSEGELCKFEIFEGDFVLNRVNSPSHLGKCGLVSKVKERMVFESNMMRIKFNKSMVNNTFMLSILSSKYLKHQILNSSKDAVNQSSINQKDVNSFEIPLPPIELQNQFAERILAIEAQKQLALASLKKSEDLFNSLLQRAFNGELTA